MKVAKPTDKDDKTNFLLWLGMLGAPVAWALCFQIDYARVLPACAGSSRLVLIVTTAVGLALTVGAGLLCLRLLSVVSGDHTREFMLYVGLMLSAVFTLLVLSHAIAVMMISPCWFPP